MKRSVVLATAVMAGVLMAPLASGASAQDTGDLAAFCEARVNVEAGFHRGDEQQITEGLESLKTNAPPEISADATLVADTLAEQGEKAFQNKKFGAAIDRVDQYALTNCGFPEVDVSGIDYEYQGIPPTLAAGTTAFRFTNDAPKEHHEMVVARVKPGVTDSTKKLLGLPEKKVVKKVEVVAAADATPGESQVSIATLEPGHYVVACFFPVNGKKHGKSHWTKGMYTEFDVE